MPIFKEKGGKHMFLFKCSYFKGNLFFSNSKLIQCWEEHFKQKGCTLSDLQWNTWPLVVEMQYPLG